MKCLFTPLPCRCGFTQCKNMEHTIYVTDTGLAVISDGKTQVSVRRSTLPENIESLETEFIIGMVRNKLDEIWLSRHLANANALEDAVRTFAKEEIAKKDCNSYYARRLNDILSEIEDTVDILQRIA